MPQCPQAVYVQAWNMRSWTCAHDQGRQVDCITHKVARDNAWAITSCLVSVSASIKTILANEQAKKMHRFALQGFVPRKNQILVGYRKWAITKTGDKLKDLFRLKVSISIFIQLITRQSQFYVIKLPTCLTCNRLLTVALFKEDHNR